MQKLLEKMRRKPRFLSLLCSQKSHKAEDSCAQPRIVVQVLEITLRDITTFFVCIAYTRSHNKSTLSLSYCLFRNCLSDF